MAAIFFRQRITPSSAASKTFVVGRPTLGYTEDAETGGNVKAGITFLCMFWALAAAQEKRIPPTAPLRDMWDVHYSELEPLLERHLANDPDSVETLGELARVESALGKYARAAELYGHALELREASTGRDSLELVPTLENLARVDQLLRKPGDAEILLARAVAIRERTQGADHADVAAEYNALARLFVVQKKYQEAEPLYVRSIQILAANYGETDSRLCPTINNLATTYREEGKLKEAEPLLR